uniref:Uncharacterized protein n=1 Tax=Acrobeloides nanus TaxID=290746 RepID=A0A914DI29_9BILA
MGITGTPTNMGTKTAPNNAKINAFLVKICAGNKLSVALKRIVKHANSNANNALHRAMMVSMKMENVVRMKFRHRIAIIAIEIKGCVCKIGYHAGKNGTCVPCEESIIDSNNIHLAAHFVDRCSLCMTQCKACQVQCIGSQRQDCGDCQQKCQFCREMCHSRSKRYDYAQKQPLPNCQRMCESLCSNGKSEDYQFCLRECESGQGQDGFVGHQKLDKLDVGQDVQSDQNESGQQQGGQHLIPLGSCRKCMTYCNLCEVQCKNSELGQPNCDRCHERCSQCREMCSSGEQSDKNDSEQGSQQLLPLGSCRKCMTYCNLCEVQCKNSELGQPNCDRCHERCSQCREMCSSDGEDQPVGQGGEKGNDQEIHGDHLGSQICQQCKEICARGLGQPCQDCLKRCDQGQGGAQDQEHDDHEPRIGQGLEHPDGEQGHQGHHNQRCQACKISCNFCLTHCQSQGDKNCESCHSSCSSCKEICQVSPNQGQREKRQSDKCQKMCESVCRRDQGCTQCLHHCLNNGGGR